MERIWEELDNYVILDYKPGANQFILKDASSRNADRRKGEEVLPSRMVHEGYETVIKGSEKVVRVNASRSNPRTGRRPTYLRGKTTHIGEVVESAEDEFEGRFDDRDLLTALCRNITVHLRPSKHYK